jgi:hypothetical protein
MAGHYHAGSATGTRSEVRRSMKHPDSLERLDTAGPPLPQRLPTGLGSGSEPLYTRGCRLRSRRPWFEFSIALGERPGLGSDPGVTLHSPE